MDVWVVCLCYSAMCAPSHLQVRVSVFVCVFFLCSCLEVCTCIPKILWVKVLNVCVCF